MAKWKYTKPKPQYQSTFLRFEEGEEKKIVLSNWNFEKAAAGYLFKCYIERENDEDVDLIWCVWDFNSAERLKKKLGAKYTSGKKELTVKMTKNEDEEQVFDIN